MSKEQTLIMNTKEFKKLFGEVAKSHGFENAFGGWFKASPESIIVLDFQKSNYGDNYGNCYSRNKDLVKKDIGDVFTRQPSEYRAVFDFDEPMDDEKRKIGLAKLFSNFIVPFTDKALSKAGIKELADKGKINLLPAVKEELG